MRRVANQPARLGLGIFYMLASSLLFVAMAFAGRVAIAHAPFQLVVALRCGVGLLVVLPVAALTTGRASFRLRQPGAMAVAGIAMTASLFAYFLALRYLPINDAIVMSFANVLFMTALSRPFLAEPVGAQAWGAVLVGFAGVVLIANPTGAGFLHPGMLLAMASALLSAATWLTVRRWGGANNSGAVTIHMLGIGFVLSVVLAPTVALADVLGLDGPDWLALLGVGLFGGIAQLLISNSYQLAPIATVSPFAYAQELWTALGAWLVWQEVPGPRVLAGTLLIVGAGLYLGLHTARRRRALA